MIYYDHHRPTILFKRYPGNPVLVPDCRPYPSNATFNPGAADTNVCLATAGLRDLVDHLLSCPDSKEEGFCF